MGCGPGLIPAVVLNPGQFLLRGDFRRPSGLFGDADPTFYDPQQTSGRVSIHAAATTPLTSTIQEQFQ